MKIKIFSLFLLLSICLTPIACNKTDTDSETTPPETTAEQFVPRLILSENGASEYKIINGKNIKADSLELLLDFVSDLRSMSSVTFARASDWSNSGSAETPEIIFGGANREECKEVYASIGFDGYAVKQVGKKIVIAGYTYDTLKLAVDAFFTQCIKVVQDGENTSLYYMNDVINEGTEGLFFTSENPLSSYKIVYATATASSASKLAMVFEEQMGIEMDMCSDKEAESEYEILLGPTNRAESQSVQPDDTSRYIVKAVGKKIVIRSTEEWSLYTLIPAIMNTFMYSSPEINFPKSIDASLVKYFGTDRAVMTKEADVRVMSFNILADDFHTDKDLTHRIPGVIGCVQYYKPDVIGFQELSRKWYNVLFEELGDEYEFLNTSVMDSITNNCYTGLAYRKDRIKMLETHVFMYMRPGNSRIRLLNVGVFENIATGERFAVTSTHLSVGEEKNLERKSQAVEHLSEVKRLLEAYKCPVISTGDYNCREGSAPYQVLVESGIMKNSKYDALEKGNITTTHHGLGVMPGPGPTGIDHIFYAGNTTPVYFSVIVDEAALRATDHCALICDFKIN